MTRPLRALVVDDQPAGAELLSFVLENEGFEVAWAADADAARRSIAAAPPDVVVMDIQLPGEDGLTLTRALKADAATRAIPVVACTAYAMKGDEAAMRAAGCDGYLPKPIDVGRFAQHVRALIGR